MLRQLVAVLAVAGTALGVAALAPAAGADSPAPTDPARPIVWGSCTDTVLTDAHAQCGMLTVPLDYHNPSGATIQLAVSRVRHTSPDDQYQGVMLINPGGPGGSGLDFAAWGSQVPDRPRRRWPPPRCACCPQVWPLRARTAS